MSKELNTTQEVSIENEISEIKGLKSTILAMAAEVCFQLGKASEKANVSFEKGILTDAMADLSGENNADSEEYCKKLLHVYYLSLGLARDFGSV